MSKYFKEGLLYSIYEYLLIVTPVGIYVAIEAFEKSKIEYFFKSPEWAIATIFLSFVGIARYVKAIENSGRKVIFSFLGILGISNVLIVVSAVLNSYKSLSLILNNAPDIKSAVIFRQILFIVVSILFFLAVAGSKAYNLKHKNSK